MNEKNYSTRTHFAYIEWISKHARTLTFIAYLAVIALVMCFHEPWFDEAQSWLIARDSSFTDLLLLRPHYEGHPPLWTLLLSIPAKTGVPYEIGLKSIQFLCSALFGGWLIFKSPFNRTATLLLPFTYFVCFQYGVTARPYALLCAGLLMSASYWKNRNSEPWKLSLTLVFLCLISAYGIALAAGFALAWILQAILSSGIQKVFKEITCNTQRFICWILIAIVGVLNTVCILPASDAFATRPTHDGNSKIIQWLSFIFVMPSESAFTSFSNDVSLRRMSLSVLATLICVIISLIMWIFVIRISSTRHTLSTLILPYLMLSIVATKYFTLHHSGIVFTFFIAQIWICVSQSPLELKDIPGFIRNLCKCSKSNTESNTELTLDSSSNSSENSNLSSSRCVRCTRYASRTISRILILVLLLPSIIWNVCACVNDIRFDYSGSRALANYISKNNAYNKRWMGSWLHTEAITDSKGNSISPETNDLRQYSWQLVTANPYFAKNLISCSHKNSSFITNELPTQQQSDEDMSSCSSKKESDYFVTSSNEPWYYFLALNYNISHYKKQDIAQIETAWKSKLIPGKVTVYKRGNPKSFVK